MREVESNRTFLDEFMIILTGLGFMVLFWILESLIHVFVFKEGNVYSQIFYPEAHEAWMRSLLVGMIFLFSLFAHFMVNIHRKSEEKIKRSHAELNQIFNTAADGMRVIDKDFNILRVNRTFSIMTNISVEEILGEKCYEVFSGPLCHTSECPLTQIMGGKESVEYEVDKERIDGENTPCIVYATPFRDNGELTGIVEDFRDVSDHKQYLKEIEKLKKRKEYILGATRTGLNIIDSNFEIQYIDPEWGKIYGDPTGRKCYEYFMDREEVCPHCGILRAREDREPVVTENVLPKEGNRPVQVTTIPFQDEMGNQLFAEVNADITQRKEIENSLKESEQKYRSLIEKAPVGIILIDVEGQIMDINPKLLEILGSPSVDSTKSINVLAFPHLVEAGISQDVKYCVEKEEPITSEKPYNSKWGKYSYLRYHLTPFYGTDGDLQGVQGIVEDITERKKAEKELEESEKRYRTTFEHTGTAMLIVEDNNIISLVNEEFEKFTGYSKSEIEGKMKWTEFIHYDDIERMKEYHRKRKRGEVVPKRYEFRTIDKQGNIKNILISADVVPGTSKTVASAMDITEIKKTEQALRDSEGKLNAMLQSIGDHMSMMDKELNVIWANDVAKQKFGENIVGKKCYEVYHRRDKPCEPSPCLTLRSFEDGEIHEHETSVIDKYGEEKFFHCTANVALKDEEGNPTGVIEISRDITDRKRTQEALQEEKNKLEAIIGSINDGLSIQDRNFNILYQNEVSKEFVGDCEGNKCYYSVHGRDEVCEDCQLELAFEDGRPYTREVELVNPSGEPVYLENTASPIKDAKGEVISSLVLVRDITNQKMAEKQVRKSLEEKEALLKEIHHRVKNNLQVISSLINLQSKYIRDDKILEVLKESQNRIKSMALIHEKLYQSEDLTRLDFTEYLRTLISHLLLSYTTGSRVDLHMDIGDLYFNLDTAIPCSLIINELVSNSLRHAFPHGRGEIDIKFYKVEDNEFKLIVSDNGKGFPEEIDYRNTDSLGLQLVNSLTKQLRGEVALHNDRGTTFEIIFPENSKQADNKGAIG